MLVWLYNYLHEYSCVFDIFQNITIRAILAAMTSLFITLFVGPIMIRKLERDQIGQIIRACGPESHSTKAGTPTMGGTLILMAIVVTTLLWNNLKNVYVWVAIGVLVTFGLIGWVDDYRKLILKNTRGIPGKWKYILQSLFAMIFAIILYIIAKTPIETTLFVPYFKKVMIQMGVFYILLTYFVIIGTSNAVNLTDGLDGLAILPVVMISIALGIFAYMTGHIKFAQYLQIPYIHGTEEIAVFCSGIAGAGLGFLWFNAYPAQVFMGDVGAIGLGAVLGVIAVIVRQELVLFIMGGVFVVETISVMLQVTSFKMTGKRIFRMAPIHHHFELKGWPEPRIIVRFWILTVILTLLGLATLKLK